MNDTAIVKDEPQPLSRWKRFWRRIRRGLRALEDIVSTDIELQQLSSIMTAKASHDKCAELAALLEGGAHLSPEALVEYAKKENLNDTLHWMKPLHPHIDYRIDAEFTRRIIESAIINDPDMLRDIHAQVPDHPYFRKNYALEFARSNHHHNSFTELLRLGAVDDLRSIYTKNHEEWAGALRGGCHEKCRALQQLENAMDGILNCRVNNNPDIANLGKYRVIAPERDIIMLYMAQKFIDDATWPCRSLLKLPDDVQAKVDMYLDTAEPAVRRARAFEILGDNSFSAVISPEPTEFRFTRRALDNSGKEIQVIVTTARLVEPGPEAPAETAWVTTHANNHQFLWSAEDKAAFEAAQKQLTRMTDPHRLSGTFNAEGLPELPPKVRADVGAAISAFEERKDPASDTTIMDRIRVYDGDGIRVHHLPFVRKAFNEQGKPVTIPILPTAMREWDAAWKEAHGKVRVPAEAGENPAAEDAAEIEAADARPSGRQDKLSL